MLDIFNLVIHLWTSIHRRIEAARFARDLERWIKDLEAGENQLTFGS